MTEPLAWVPGKEPSGVAGGPELGFGQTPGSSCPENRKSGAGGGNLGNLKPPSRLLGEIAAHNEAENASDTLALF